VGDGRFSSGATWAYFESAWCLPNHRSKPKLSASVRVQLNGVGPGTDNRREGQVRDPSVRTCQYLQESTRDPAFEVVDFSRKHTTNVREALGKVRGIIENLIAKRDVWRDGFVDVIRANPRNLKQIRYCLVCSTRRIVRPKSLPTTHYAGGLRIANPRPLSLDRAHPMAPLQSWKMATFPRGAGFVAVRFRQVQLQDRTQEC